MRRLVHMSVDLAKQVGLMLEDVNSGISGKVISQYIFTVFKFIFSYFLWCFEV